MKRGRTSCTARALHYAQFVRRYFAHYAKVDCAPTHLEAARRLLADPHYHGLWKWFRGAAKSTHGALMMPLWLAAQGQLQFALIVGKTKESAESLLKDMRDELEGNAAFIADFAVAKIRYTADRLELRLGDAEVTFAAVGSGQSPRGIRARQRRPDYIVADDLDHAALSANPARVRKATAWLLEDLLGTFDEGNARFVLLNNLFSRTSILHTLEQSGRFDVIRMDALDADGQPTWPAKYPTRDYFERRESLVGYTAFQREYMNTPIDEGHLFRSEWVRYVEARPLDEYKALIGYIDPSYRDTPSADYSAVKVWGRLDTDEGTEYHQLAAYVRRASLTHTARWCCDLYERWNQPAHLQFVIEGNHTQADLMRFFSDEGRRRGYDFPIRADRRQKPDKLIRLERATIHWESGRARYAAGLRSDPDTQTGLEQWFALCQGSRAHDDGPDADEGALV